MSFLYACNITEGLNAQSTIYKQTKLYASDLFATILNDLEGDNIDNDARLKIENLENFQEKLTLFVQSFDFTTQSCYKSSESENLTNLLKYTKEILDNHYSQVETLAQKTAILNQFDRMMSYINLSHGLNLTDFNYFLQNIIHFKFMIDEIALGKLYPVRTNFVDCINCKKHWSKYTKVIGKKALECLLCGHEEIENESIDEQSLTSSQQKKVLVSQNILSSSGFFGNSPTKNSQYAPTDTIYPSPKRPKLQDFQLARNLNFEINFAHDNIPNSQSNSPVKNICQSLNISREGILSSQESALTECDYGSQNLQFFDMDDESSHSINDDFSEIEPIEFENPELPDKKS